VVDVAEARPVSDSIAWESYPLLDGENKLWSASLRVDTLKAMCQSDGDLPHRQRKRRIANGEYRPRRVILEMYDAMQRAINNRRTVSESPRSAA